LLEWESPIRPSNATTVYYQKNYISHFVKNKWKRLMAWEGDNNIFQDALVVAFKTKHIHPFKKQRKT
jgi:hypothetical protein